MYNLHSCNLDFSRFGRKKRPANIFKLLKTSQKQHRMVKKLHNAARERQAKKSSRKDNIMTLKRENRPKKQ